MSLVRKLLDYINKLRRDNGVPPVMYANSGAANYRVNYMFRENLFSHYDREGIHPIYYFTLTGNFYGAEESIGYAQSEGLYFKDGVSALNGAKRMIYDMVYNDQESNWGHRDSLLDPCFNYADVSVAWDSRRLFLDVMMMAVWTRWEMKPSWHNGRFRMKGTVKEMMPEGILIYWDEPNPSYISRPYYDFGRPLAGVLPDGYEYHGIKTITSSKWIMGEKVEVEFPLNLGVGVYTVLQLAKDRRGINWRPMTSKRVGECLILTYAFRNNRGL
jgi:hypothetical protein